MYSYPQIKSQSFDNPKETLLVSAAAHHVNYWISFIADPAMLVFFIVWEATILRTSILLMIISYGAALLNWSLLEYVAHRWMYHKGRTPAHAGHKMHHDSPKMLIAMPWFIITAFLVCVWYVFAYYLQFRFVLSFMAGLLTGFIFYGAFHHVHHHSNFKNSWYRKMRTHHFIHHQFPNVNFGVTSRLWDHVFGTAYRKQTKKRPPMRAEESR